MGYYMTCGATRDSIIAELIANKPDRCTVAHTLRGSVLWTVQEVTRDAKPERFIGCYLLERSTDGYGYKPMSESVGPYHYDCPLAYLDMVPVPESSYAAGWREMVRAFHASTRAKRAKRAALKPGQTVELREGCKPPRVTIVTVRPLVGEYGGTRYKVSPRFLREDT